MGEREALEGAFEQFAQGDFRSATKLYDPAVEWIEHRPVPGGGDFAGLDGVRNGFRGWLSSWRDYRLELLERRAACYTLAHRVVQRGQAGPLCRRRVEQRGDRRRPERHVTR